MKKMKISKKIGILAFVSAIFMFASCVGTTNPGNSGTNGTENGGGQTDSTPSIVLDQTSVTLDDAIPLYSTAQIKATVSNASGATIQWLSDSKTAYSVSGDSSDSSYATLTTLLGGSGKITAGIVVNEKAYKASANVTVNLATAASSNITVNEDTDSKTDHSFKVTWATPTSSSESEKLSVLSYIAALYKVDSETKTESLIAFSKLDFSTTEKSFSNETTEDYSVSNYSIDSATTYKVKLYCIYSVSSTEDETSTTTYSVNEKELTTATDDSTPDPVNNATMALASDSSSITLSWTNSADTDLTTFKITPYINGTAQDVISLSKDDSENGIDFTASANNTYTYDLTSSKTEQIFKFTITAYDDAGNPTSLEGDDNAKYIVSFKTSGDDSETSITVAGDSNPPAKASDLAITIKSIADSTVTYDASWTNPTDSDFKEVLINGNAVSGTSVENATVSLSDISSGFTVSSVDEAGNENVITVPVELFKSENLASASNATVENHLSGYKVTNITKPTTTVESATYTYAVVALEDGEIVSSSAYFTSDTSTFLLGGLSAGKKYTVVASTKITSDDYTVIYTESTGTSSSVAAKTVVWEIHSPWLGNGAIAPYMTASVTYQNVIHAGYTSTDYNDIEDFTYNAWIVEPALDGDVDSFSLEATVANKGEHSGYYMIAGSSTKYSKSNWNPLSVTWSYTASDYAYHAWVTNDFDDEDTKLMSFKKLENTDYSGTVSSPATGYYYITLDYNGNMLWGKNANMSFETATTSTSGDYAFYTVEHTFDGTSSSPSEVSYTTTKGPTTASITFTIEDSDIASYKVSTTGTNSSGESIDDVEESSNLGLMGSHTVSYSNLSRGTDYTFTITVKNSSGNSSSTTVNITTYNFTPISDIVVNMYDGTVSWTAPSDSSVTAVGVTVDSNDENKITDLTTTSVTGLTLSTGSTVTVTTYATVDSTEVSSATEITLPSSSNFASASSATVENHLSGYKVTGLTLPSSTSGTATYAVVALEDGEIVSSSAYFTSDTSTFLLGGLLAGKKYTVVASTKITGDDYTVIYTESTGTSSSVAAKTVVWEIHSPWQGNGVIAPYMTSAQSSTSYKYTTSSSYQNVIQAGYTDTSFSNIEDFTYNAWIVQPALNGDEDSFSLEATVANTGASSGYYMTTGSSSKYSSADWNITGKVKDWSYSASSYDYHAWVTNDFDDEDTDLMSFKKTTASGYSGTVSSPATGYYYITLDKNDYVLFGSTANMHFVSASAPSDGAYAFYTVEHTFDGTSSSPSQVSYTTEKTSTTASITFTISDSDIASYKVSTTDTNSSGESIDDVEESSNLGLMGSHTVSYTGLSRNTPYTFTITVTDVSGLSTDTTVSITTDNSYAPTNVTVAPRYTGELLVTWTEEDDISALDDDITYVVTLTPESGDALTKTGIVGGVKTARFYDLTIGTKYTAKVVATYNSTEYEAEETTGATVSKVIWRIRNGQYPSDARFMTPTILTESPVSVTSGSTTVSLSTDYHVCLTNSNQTAGTASSSNWYCDYSNLTYTYWLVMPALDETEDAFSLMATNSSGDKSGYYLYLDSGTTRNVPSKTECYQAAWWTTQSVINAIENKAFVATLDGTENSETSYITDKTRASFVMSDSSSTTTVSGYSTAKNFKATCGLYLGNPDGHCNFSGTSSIGSESKYWDFWYVETLITEETTTSE